MSFPDQDKHVLSDIVMGAALAFYAVFSLAPLLLIVIAIAGAVFGQEELFAREWRQLWDV